METSSNSCSMGVGFGVTASDGNHPLCSLPPNVKGQASTLFTSVLIAINNLTFQAQRAAPLGGVLSSLAILGQKNQYFFVTRVGQNAMNNMAPFLEMLPKTPPEVVRYRLLRWKV